MADKTELEQLSERWGEMFSERASWMSHWQEISMYVMPRNGRYFVQDRNKGWRRHNAIYDRTGSGALKVLAAGLMSGLTSPARPWFRLAVHDQALMKRQAVKVWLNDCTNMMLRIFQKSNTYRALHGMYHELGGFGTAASVFVEDYNNVIHLFPLTVGEYAIATGWNGQVNTLYRRFDKTVAEIVKEFGLDVCSTRVQNLYRNGQLGQWITVMHVIEPRADRDLTMRDGRNMAYRSCYFEEGNNEGKFLRDGGFKSFRALVPRWEVSGGDVYGNSPGMEALGDIKQLQHEQLRKGQVIDYKTKPPLQVPTGMKHREVENLPGGISYYDAASQSGGIKTLFETNLDLSHLLEDIRDVRGRINDAFYADVFAMISRDPDGQKTATEIAALQEEKMVLLGPVLERLQNELLDPLISMTFQRMLTAGILPPPPPEMRGQQLNVELVSMLAQAQRAIATNSVDRFVINLGQIAQFKPEVLDKFDADTWADKYSDMLGVDPELIVASDQVALIRKNRQQQQAQAAQSAIANQNSQTLANLGKVDTSGSNAATDAINQFSGYTQNGGVLQ